MNGYYFTQREQEDMQEKGYSIKLCSSQIERDELAIEYKSKGYRVRKAYDTTRVRGLYDYYLWIKYEPAKEKVQKVIKDNCIAIRRPKNKDAYYKKLCEQSARRVLPKIRKFIQSEGLYLNEPYIAGAMYNKGKVIGNCRNKRIIRVQASFLDRENKLALDKVMIHEILHCVRETHGHDKLFKDLQRNMGYIMGYNISSGNRGGIIDVSIYS